MEIYNEKGERVNGRKNTSNETDRKELIKIMLISGAIDIATTSGTIASLGLGIVVEELIESAVSQMIAKYGKINLSAADNAIGLLPIPGVTAITVHCARKLFAMKAVESFSK